METIVTKNLRIKDGTEFIVFDLEWNQPFPGKEYPFDVTSLKGEIIDIGAEKYVYSYGLLSYAGKFSVTVRPKYYKKLHYHVKKLTNKTNAELMSGESFDKASADFMKFCGSDAVLVGWGNSDPEMLKINLKFSGLNDVLGMPFVDIQPIFSYFAGEQGMQRSVEYAVDFYSIQKDDTFHSAWADSMYTGLVLKKIFEQNKTSEVLSIFESSMVDPDVKNEFSFVGDAYKTAEEAINSKQKFPTVCPFCEEPLSDNIKDFRIRKSIYALKSCEIHGDFFLRTRIKHSKKGYYAAMVMRVATQSDYSLAAAKFEEYKKYGINGAPLPLSSEPQDAENSEKLKED